MIFSRLFSECLERFRDALTALVFPARLDLAPRMVPVLVTP